jgi:hypothetical protein
MSDDRELAVYDGQTLIGSIVVQGRSHEAFGADGVSLGKFTSVKAAAAEISAAHRRVALGAAARRRLSEPAEFASGLPVNFLGAGR